MQVFTPTDIAKRAGNKYLGVLVAAKFARLMNEFPRSGDGREKKLTTKAFEELTSEDGITYRVTPRRRP
jgi:DNA-directed RNA polymerase subunit K/omega